MGTLHFVRHGQASFGAADYDQLSPHGYRQCEALGTLWRSQNLRFDAVHLGTLKRHRQSLQALLKGLGAQALEDTATVWPGLDEYHPEAIVRAVHPGPLSAPKSPEDVKQHFRLLRTGLLAWMGGESKPEGMPSHSDFMKSIVAVLDHIRSQHLGQRVLVVSSGGPISHAVGHVLQAPAETVVELNLRLRNSAVCEMAITPRRHALVSFNELPHLQSAEHAGWITHA